MATRLTQLPDVFWEGLRRLGPRLRLSRSSLWNPSYSYQSLSIEPFRQAPTVYPNRFLQLQASLALAPAEGHILEFGVFRGDSINFLAGLVPERPIVGFDSFVGLPKKWIRTRSGTCYEAGHFAVEHLPKVAPNVQLVPGFFDRTLPLWLSGNDGPVALLHNDSDLYSSTVQTLSLLNDRIVPRTVIVFDELSEWGDTDVYDNWAEGEWQALREWMRDFSREITVLSRDRKWAAAIRVTV